MSTNLQKKSKVEINLNDNYENIQNSEAHFGKDINNLDVCATNTENDKSNVLINDRENEYSITSWVEKDNNNEAMKSNNLEKNVGDKENDGKVETPNDNIERGNIECLKVIDNNLQNKNNQAECYKFKNVKTSNVASCSEIVNDNTKCDITNNNEQSHNAYVELHRDINSNNSKASLNADLKNNNNTQDQNSSSEESNDSDESNEISDCNMDKLDKRYRQSNKSNTKTKSSTRKQGNTKRNNSNDVNKVRENNSNNIVNNEKCCICGQFLNDPELLYYQGHPQHAVEEYIALTDDKLVLTVGKFEASSGLYIYRSMPLGNLVSAFRDTYTFSVNCKTRFKATYRHIHIITGLLGFLTQMLNKM